ncbi:MAG: hypothetical protein VKL42_08865 [Snowella sp.]|nr:hypothetical protein [Snowella sp.]
MTTSIQNMPYKVNLDNVPYDIPKEFNIAIIDNSGLYVSDCILVNNRGDRCLGWEYPIPITNSNLTELTYPEIGELTRYGNFNLCWNKGDN